MPNDDALVTLTQLMESHPADQVELAIHCIANANLSDRRPSPDDVIGTLSFQEIAALLQMLQRIPKDSRGRVFLTIRGLGSENDHSLEAWSKYLLKLSDMIDGPADG